MLSFLFRDPPPPPPQHMWMSSVTGGVGKVGGRANKLCVFQLAESRAHSATPEVGNVKAGLNCIGPNYSAAHLSQERTCSAKNRGKVQKNEFQTMESDLRKGLRDLGADTIIYDCMYQIIICKQSKEQFICTINVHLFCLSVNHWQDHTLE